MTKGKPEALFDKRKARSSLGSGDRNRDWYSRSDETTKRKDISIMAKLSARGATEVARIRSSFWSNDLNASINYLWVLRSDGKVLRRITGDVGTSYTVFSTVPTVPTDKEVAKRLLARIAVKRGHAVVI